MSEQPQPASLYVYDRKPVSFDDMPYPNDVRLDLHEASKNISKFDVDELEKLHRAADARAREKAKTEISPFDEISQRMKILKEVRDKAA